ncbi:hypothetical protein L914_02902 [Phytophthora nicotianae]|uniref:Uncharacterized protein n=1 Tax=Phytophthora nicotianae TaxID=4792 RepID=W2NYR2_PHYNI|nr:hypothetical protein L914_02902 [Phytophthora nicotianae]
MQLHGNVVVCTGNIVKVLQPSSTITNTKVVHDMDLLPAAAVAIEPTHMLLVWMLAIVRPMVWALFLVVMESMLWLV